MNFFPAISRQIPENSDVCRVFNQICENKLENCRKFLNLWKVFIIIHYYSPYHIIRDTFYFFSVFDTLQKCFGQCFWNSSSRGASRRMGSLADLLKNRKQGPIFVAKRLAPKKILFWRPNSSAEELFLRPKNSSSLTATAKEKSTAKEKKAFFSLRGASPQKKCSF